MKIHVWNAYWAREKALAVSKVTSGAPGSSAKPSDTSGYSPTQVVDNTNCSSPVWFRQLKDAPWMHDRPRLYHCLPHARQSFALSSTARCCRPICLAKTEQQDHHAEGGPENSASATLIRLAVCGAPRSPSGVVQDLWHRMHLPCITISV